MTEVNICSICLGQYSGYGNNAEPVNQGRCCDECNQTAVIPARQGARVKIVPGYRRPVTYTFYDGEGGEVETATVPADEASGRAAAFILAQASEGLAGRVEFLNPEEI